MPLPTNNTAWPPAELDRIAPAMQAWDSWWVGDPDALLRAYRNGGTAPRPGQTAGGVVGAVSRFFWGRPNADLTQNTRKLHIPLATDICQASADLLYSEAPTVTVDAEADGEAGLTQKRLAELIDDGLLQTLAEGAEVGAALGGHYLRVTWDEQLNPDAPFLTAVHADAALPEFRWDRLVAVTFWSTVRTAGQQVWRHLEHHRLDDAGTGIIEHALYLGTVDNLGRQVPLTDHTATAGLVTAERPDGTVSTESPGLAVVYVPNQRPQRRWRTHPVGKSLGRSDLDGVEGMLDALDEVWSSWMRDIRLAKARIMVPAAMLADQGPGRGAAFDLDQEVFTPVNMLPSREASGMPIEAQQFAIRFEEHRATAEELINQILETAGYSPATFGRGNDGAAMTATEVRARQQRSFLTRDRKLRHLRPALSDLLEKLLAVDAAIFRTPGVQALRPQVEFPDGVQDSMLTLAQTAQALKAAEAASIRTVVEMVHPEWDTEQVDEEAARIRAESGLPPLADPTDPATGAGEMAPDQLAQMIQKIYLGVGTVVTSEEARGILNEAGANLTGPPPQPSPSPSGPFGS